VRPALDLLLVAPLAASAEAALATATDADAGAGDARGLGIAPAPVIELSAPAPRVLTLDLTRDANDIWDRIRRGFGMPEPDSGLVAEQQLFYINRPGFLKKVFERGGRTINPIFPEIGLPTPTGQT
jgi:membrane-bound lytic murein transglycosylase D